MLAFSRIAVLASFSMPWASQALLCKATETLVVYEDYFVSIVVLLKDMKFIVLALPLSHELSHLLY